MTCRAKLSLTACVIFSLCGLALQQEEASAQASRDNEFSYRTVNKVVRGTGAASLHVFCPTIGRDSILALLASLSSELNSHDYLTIIFDGQDRDGVYDKVQAALDTMPVNATLLNESHDWHADAQEVVRNGPIRAHRLRNMFLETQLSQKGNFLLFADDDNWYEPNFAERIKDVVSQDTESPYFFRGYFDNQQRLLWHKPEIAYGNIDTMCAVMPVAMFSRVHSRWGEHHGGDFSFFLDLIDHVDRYYMVDIVIFRYTQPGEGLR